MRNYLYGLVLGTLSILTVPSTATATTECPAPPPGEAWWWESVSYTFPSPPNMTVVDAALETNSDGKAFGHWVVVRNPTTNQLDVHSKLASATTWDVIHQNVAAIEETVDGGVAILENTSPYPIHYWHFGSHSTISNDTQLTPVMYGVWKPGVAIATALQNNQLYQTVNGATWNQIGTAQATTSVQDTTFGFNGQAFMTGSDLTVWGYYGNGWNKVQDPNGYTLAHDLAVCNYLGDTQPCVAVRYNTASNSIIAAWTGTNTTSPAGKLNIVAITTDMKELIRARADRLALTTRYVTNSNTWAEFTCFRRTI